MAARLRSSVTPCAIVAWLSAGPSPRPLGLERAGRKLRARLWKRRLSLFGLLLLTLGVIGMRPGWVARGGGIARVLQAVVGLEAVLMGGWLESRKKRGRLLTLGRVRSAHAGIVPPSCSLDLSWFFQTPRKEPYAS